MRTTVGKLAIIGVLLLASSGLTFAQPVEWPMSAGGNGHFYERVIVDYAITWADARLLAEQRLHNGLTGHLATFTSAAENAFCFGIWGCIQNDGWAGAFQPAGSPEPAGNWQWVTGEPWEYAAWSGAEPNDCCTSADGEEDCLYVWFCDGTWNDSNTGLAGPPRIFYVEYEEPVVPIQELSWGAIRSMYR